MDDLSRESHGFYPRGPGLGLYWKRPPGTRDVSQRVKPNVAEPTMEKESMNEKMNELQKKKLSSLNGE